MVDHLQDPALDPQWVQREQTEHDETQVTHGRVCYKLLDIFLRVGNRRAVDDSNHRQESHPRGEAN